MFKKVLITIALLMILTSASASELQYLQPPQLDIPSAEQSRQEWEEALNFDVWAPYFYLLHLEHFISFKMSINLGPFHGKPEFNYKQKQIIYKFQWRF